MRVFVLPPRENWVVDRLASEWFQHNSDITVSRPEDADVIWLLADWCWNHVSLKLLEEKVVVATVWHIVPEKFGEHSKREFVFRDRFVDFYHAPSQKSREQIESLELTQKPIFHQLPWVNQDLWFPMDKEALREKYSISKDAFLIGSFQRDTEGHDLVTPKLEKGPDRFCDEVIARWKENPNVEVLLGGWRRQYVMRRLDEAGIKYHYYDRKPDVVLNELYNMLDLYIVGSRYEGGPQAIVECAASMTPVISTDVGLAAEILSPESIFEPGLGVKAIPNVKNAFEAVEKLFIPDSFAPFRSTLEKMAGESK